MPTIGEIARGDKVGFKYNGAVMWHSCIDCGKERWVEWQVKLKKPARLTLRGVEHLVQCLKEGKQSISSGEEARLTLSLVLQYKKIIEEIPKSRG